MFKCSNQARPDKCSLILLMVSSRVGLYEQKRAHLYDYRNMLQCLQTQKQPFKGLFTEKSFIFTER